MLRSVLFALAVAVVAASPMGPAGGKSFAPFADERSPLSGHAQEELMRMAREVVGEGEEECDNEEEVFKWFPPLPCRVENATFDALAQRQCPEDGQCNVGPVDTMLNTTAVRTFFCSRPGKYMLYQACRVQNAETGEEREASQCASYDGEPVACTVGPFSVLSNKTNYIAYYCDTTMMDSLQKVAARGLVSQACRVENHYGDDLLRRVCPHGFRCNHGPMDAMMNNKSVQAYLCKEKEHEMSWNWTLSETVTHLVVEKEVDPFVILMVMRHLQDHNVNITAKVVYDLVLEQVKAHMEEMDKEREEHEKQDPKENIENIMHMLEHRRLLNMEAELRRRMYEEKNMDKEGSADDLMHMLHHISLVAMEAKLTGKQDEGSMADLVKGMLGDKMGREEEEHDDDMGLDDLLKKMMGEKKEDMSKEAMLKRTLMRAAFVQKVIGKVQEIGEKAGDEEAKMLMLLKGIHDLLEENKDIMPEVSGEVRVVKVVKAVMYVKNNFEGAEKEKDEDVKWMLIIAKHILSKAKEEEKDPMKELLGMLMGKKEDQEDKDPMKELLKMLMGEKKEDMSEEAMLKRTLMRAAFVQKVIEKVQEIGEKAGDEETKMLMLLKGIHDLLEENKDIMPELSGEVRVVKVVKAVMYVKNNFEGAEKEKDEDVKWMLIIAKNILSKAKEEEKDPMKELLGMLMGMKEDQEEKDPMKELLGMLMGKKEDREDKDPMKELLGMLMGKKEDYEDKDPMKVLLAMLMGKKEEREEENPLKMLMALLMGEKMPEEEEKGDMLKEIMSAIQQLMEKQNGAEDEGAQVMAFIKAMMGGEGDTQDILHYLHHAHMIKTEAEMKEKYEEMSKQRESESKAQELLQFLHSTMQGRQMGGGYGLPPMAGRW